MAGVHILSILSVITKEQLLPLSELVRIFLAAIQMCHGEVRQYTLNSIKRSSIMHHLCISSARLDKTLQGVVNCPVCEIRT